MLIRCIFGVLLAAQCVLMIPVDNDVVGEPEVECAGEAIGITFRTKNPFNGRLYVKGRYDDGECRNALIGRTFTAISLQFETCGMTRLRSLNPRGIFTSIAVVISFHPQFVTKVDRVYNIQCFYMEADKTVNQQLQVAELNTAFITATVPMPVCSYEILNGGPNGEPVSYAIVGQQVYHKWTCDTETQNTFCMIVQSCFIDDGRGNKVEMINEEGCAIDKHIITNLEYPEDLVAGQEAHVFKYADRSALFFQCQISISLKEPGATCPLPLCAQPLRQKRYCL
ncbi:unnamed protein product [Anisakis simplex]|uniref:ZP domain-containing protein n=1 Tax=Anisakis simplex TaxID=6269 RepID=A0A0M3IY66_ANISI|nr:unnamed protein product [Anisakis simplex]